MIGWLRTLHRRWRDRPDPKAVSTGYTYRHVGFDEAQQVKAAKAAERHEISKRKLAALRAKTSESKGAVVRPEFGKNGKAS